MAIVKNNQKINVGEEKLDPCALLVWMEKMVSSLWKTIWENVKIEYLLYDPYISPRYTSIPLVNENIYPHKNLTSMSIAA